MKEAAAAALDADKNVPPSPGRASISRSCKAMASAAAAPKTSSGTVDPPSRPSAMSSAPGTEGDISELRSMGQPGSSDADRKASTPTAGGKGKGERKDTSGIACPEEKEEAKKRIAARRQAAAVIDASGFVSQSGSDNDNNDEDNNDDGEDGEDVSEEGSNFSGSNSALDEDRSSAGEDDDGSKSGSTSAACESDNGGSANDDTNPDPGTNPDKDEATASSPPRSPPEPRADAIGSSLHTKDTNPKDTAKAPGTEGDISELRSMGQPGSLELLVPDTAKVTARSLRRFFGRLIPFVTPFQPAFYTHVQLYISCCLCRSCPHTTPSSRW